MATPQEFFQSSESLTPEQFFADGQVSVPTPESEEQKLSFAQRFGGDLFNRMKVAEEIMQATAEGDQSFGEGILQVVGKVGAGGVLDFLGEGLVSGARGLSTITPDVIENPVKDAATAAGVLFLDTEVGKAGLNALEKGVESYDKFKEERPRAARNIESVINVGLLLAPAKKSASPTTPADRPLQRVAQNLNVRAAGQDAASRTAFVDDLIRPKQTAKVRLEQTARTTEQGPLRNKVVALSPGEQTIAREVQRVPEVSQRKTLQGNLNAIRNELGEEASRLRSMLDEGGASITRGEVTKSLEGAKTRLGEVPTITGNAQRTADRLVDAAVRFVDDNPPTSTGLLKARQQFDNFVTSQRANALGDAATENALTIAAREVRQTMNQLLQIKNPTAGVRESLSRQSNLFRAIDNIGPKAADEAASVISRAWQNAMKVLPFRGEFNQLMATAFGVGGLGASARFAPAFTKLVTLGGLTYAGGKIVLSAPAKRALSRLISTTDDAIGVATNPDMLRQLRADRALLVELSKEAN